MNKSLFEQVVRREFRYLEERYGFAARQTIDYGREVFVDFERDAQQVSVSLEFGRPPIVEIFYPIADTEDRATPWAEKNGVERARRFPRMTVRAAYPESEDAFSKYIHEMAAELEKAESSWLTARPRPPSPTNR